MAATHMTAPRSEEARSLDRIAPRLDEVRTRMAHAAADAGRSSDDVALVAVSKAHPVEAIAEAYEHGQRDFGENRADELAAKAVVLPGDIRWHFVGALQSRKADVVRPHTSLLHSLDRPSLLRRWAGEGAPPVLVQVNIGEEPQKAGVAPGDLAAMLERTAAAGVEYRGLMIIPPRPEKTGDTRMWCDRLVELAATHRRDHPDLVELSMGMTDDFEEAIAAGSTMVRVGRAIFGART